jgi:hypothetical protein
LNRIPHPWTLLGSVLAYPSLDSSLLKLKVLILLWTRTPSQFGLVSSIFFLNSSRQYPGNLYPIDLPKSRPNSLPKLHLSALLEPYPIASMLTRPYTLIPDRITLPDSSPDRTYTYPALHGLTRLNYLTQFFSRLDFYLPGLTWSYPIELPYPISSDQTSAYPIVPGRVRIRCTHPLTRPYPLTLPYRVPQKHPHWPPTLT